MPANQEVLREFLVSLGWKIDANGQRKFATSIAIQTEAVRELGEVIKETGKKVFEFTRKLAEGTFALQGHDPKSVIHYKNIRVKRLD